MQPSLTEIIEPRKNNKGTTQMGLLSAGRSPRRITGYKAFDGLPLGREFAAAMV
jgi:hypothetical protein